MAQPALFEIRIPEGQRPGFAIDYTGNGSPEYRSETWLSQGFAGVRFIGAGPGRTVLKCGGHDGITVMADRHPGLVQIENLTIEAGYAKAIHFGLASKAPVEPKFKLRLLNVDGFVPPPQAGFGRTKWWNFSYNADLEFIDCNINADAASEHASYAHGFASKGLVWNRVNVSAGAECLKVRSDITETVWAGKRVQVNVKNSTFGPWYRDWSDRGGAGIVLQGAAADLLVDSCVFIGGPATPSIPASSRAKCIMVSSEGDSYDMLTGRIGTGFGNGFVIVKGCALKGGPGQENYTTILRVGRNGGSQMAARGVSVTGCGIWGQRMSVQVKDIPAGKFRLAECNTPAIRERCEAMGFDTTYEAGIPTASRVVPVSEGFVA